jgi:putative tricarboxylic transport membrane protein
VTTSDISTREGAPQPRPGWTADRIGELIFAGLVLALGVYTFIGAFAIRTPAGVQVGPRVFPLLVSVILVGAGTALVIGVLRGHLGAREEGEDIDPNAKTDWWTIAKIIALVLGAMLLLEILGWWLVAALLFGGTAWALGAKRWWLAFLVGLVLGIGTQILFGEFLGLFLPRGLLFDAWYGPGPLFG